MTRSRPLLAPILVAVATFVSGGAAFAQSEKAFDHFDRGAKLYFEGEYRGAIQEFRAGYEIEPHPMFQVNIAVAHWRLDELLDAIAAADLAASQSALLEPPIAAENAARRATFSVMRVANDRALAVAADIAAAESSEPIVSAPVEPAPDPLFSPLGWVGVGAAGVGAVLLVGWIVAEVGMNDDVQRFERAAEQGDAAAYNSLGGDLKGQQRTARILLGSGAALAAVGAGLIVFDLLASDDSATAVTLFASDGPGFALRHRF